MLVSIVIPCYNEEESLHLLYDEICSTAESMKLSHQADFEFIFIDDGCTDHTLELIKKMRAKDPRVRYLSFSRNFGKEAGIYAGLEAAKGDYIAMMDADLQDPPNLLPQMLDGLLSREYDCVATRRTTRKGEPPIRSLFAGLFYRLFNKITDVTIMDGARDYRLMTRQMVKAVLSVKEYNRFSKGIFSWVGFRTKWLEYENVERVGGVTKWSFWKLLMYSIDGLVNYTTAPLAVAAFVGLLFCLLSVIGIIFIICRTIIFGDPTSGWPSMVCIMLLVSGIQLFCVGIVGEYLAKIYIEVKKRPLFVLRETEEDAHNDTCCGSLRKADDNQENL